MLPHLKLRYAGLKILAMLKLIVRNHALLQYALNTLADVGAWNAPHNQYESYPNHYSDRTGSMLPFMVRLLECEANYILSKDLTFFFTLHAYCISRAQSLSGTSKEGTTNGATETPKQVARKIDPERLFRGPGGAPLAEEVETIFLEYDDTKPEVWYQRADEVAFSLLTRQIQGREPLLGLQTVGQLLPHYLKTDTMVAIVLRLYLLVGDVKAARRTLVKLEDLSGEKSNIATIHRGFVLAADSQYQEALVEFHKIINSEPQNISAINNASICYTFLENAQKAVTLLEDALFSNPQANLNETSIFNLCTLYELLSDKAVERRRKVLQLVLDHAPDHFNLLSLRLPAGSLAPTNHPPITP